MDWVGAEAELDGWQGTSRPHLQGGQPLSAHAARGRGFVGHPARQAGGVHAPTLAHQAFTTPINEDRRHRACQQDRTHGLGDDGAWNILQGACITGRLKHARARARADEVGKGNRRINAPSRSIRRSGHPILASAASRLRAFDRDLICGEHYGQRSKISAAQTGRTHGSTDQLCITVKISLANTEPSTHGFLMSALTSSGHFWAIARCHCGFAMCGWFYGFLHRVRQ